MATTKSASVSETIADEDAWAYTPENIARTQRALKQRGYRLSEEDVLKIAEDAEAAHQEGREYHVDERELEAMEAKNLAAEAKRRAVEQPTEL